MRTIYLLQGRMTSQYGLLGRMSDEIGSAFAARGWRAADATEADADVAAGRAEPGSFMLWPNFVQSLEVLPRCVREGSLPGVMYYVDHPLAIGGPRMDELSALATPRIALPCADGLHLLGLRWPGVRLAHVLHGAPRTALVDADEAARTQADGSRGVDVVVCGTVLTERELEAKRDALPAGMRPMADEAAALLTSTPWMSIEQALDLCFGVRGVSMGEWAVLGASASYIVARVNRTRRLAWVKALDGLKVMVFGKASWREVCRGTIVYAGEMAYAETPAAMRRAKACLAWGPTQFTHSFSERLLLALAGGAAAVADARLLQRAHFGSVREDGSVGSGGRAVLREFDARSPESVRAAVDGLLSDDAARAEIARRGVLAVERGHLWEHRVDRLAAFAAAGERAAGAA